MNLEIETLEFKKSTGELKEAMNSVSAILNKHQHGELYFVIRIMQPDKVTKLQSIKTE